MKILLYTSFASVLASACSSAPASALVSLSRQCQFETSASCRTEVFFLSDAAVTNERGQPENTELDSRRRFSGPKCKARRQLRFCSGMALSARFQPCEVTSQVVARMIQGAPTMAGLSHRSKRRIASRDEFADGCSNRRRQGLGLSLESAPSPARRKAFRGSIEERSSEV